MIDLYIMGIIYFVLGIIHFTHPKFYKPMMPKFLPAHLPLIYMSGVAKIVLGLGIFFTSTRSLALWGIIAMLTVFLVVHVNMLIPKNRLKMPLWSLILRLHI